MQQLEADGELDREVEFLPRAERDAGAARRRAGLTRPELSVLLAYAKRSVYRGAARERSAGQRLPARRPGPVLPARHRGSVRPSARRTSAAPRAHRDHGVERRRELAGHHVRVAHGHRDGRRAPPTWWSRSVSRATSPARSSGGPTSRRSTADRPGRPERAHERGRLARRDHRPGGTWSRRPVSALVGGGRGVARVVRRALDGPRPDRPRRLARGARARGPAARRRRRARGRGAPARVPAGAGPRSRHHRRHPRVGPSAARGRAGLLPARASASRSTGSRPSSRRLNAGTRWQRWAQQSTEDDLFALRRELCEEVLVDAADRPIDEAVERSSRRARRPAHGCSASCASSRWKAWATSPSSRSPCGSSAR